MFYLLGVGLGVLIVIFLFGDRDLQCSYFPNDRVLYDLRSKNLVIPQDIDQRMTEQRLDSTDISDMLRGGVVDFSKSNREPENCKTYWVDLKREDMTSFAILWENCDSTATALSFELLK